MLMFTLAISCLTTSNLPWFMDLTFQVPMQYCFLQHCILLPSPVTSTTGWCFCFGSVSSFFLELFLHSSPVAYWAPTNVGSSSSYIFAFPYCSWGSQGKNTEVVCHSLFQWTTFYQKEIEENNRMQKTRNLLKKIRDTKGTFHAKMGTVKDRNDVDLTEAEDFKKRWQEYIEELYKKNLHDQISTMMWSVT